MRSKDVLQDALASIAVFFVALPLCMAVALASGYPPSAGLITGIVGGLVVGTLQGTPLQVSGPAAGLTVIVLELLRTHGASRLGIIVFLAGVLQIAGALLRGARLFRAIPPAVIAGMMAGIGVIVFSGQFHVMIDDRPGRSTLINILTIPRAIQKAAQFSADLPHEEAALVGVMSIAILFGWSKVKSKIATYLPGPLLAIVVVSLFANILKFPIAYVNPPENIFSTLSTPSLSTITAAITDSHVWLAAIGLALVASAETLLCSVATDRLSLLHKADLNKELLAQGVGNTLCGLMGVLPMTGVVVRTSVNVQAGARTRLSAILHGLWLMVLVLIGAKLLRFVPVCSLAAILVYSGAKLITQQNLSELRAIGRVEIATYFITIFAIIATDLLKGVLIGLTVGTIAILVRLSNCRITILRDVVTNATTVKLVGAATFLAVPKLAEVLDEIETGAVINIDYSRATLLDSAVLQALKTWSERHVARGGVVEIDWNALNVRFFGLVDRSLESIRPAALGG